MTSLFCTDTMWARYGDLIRDAAPDVEPLLLTGDDRVPSDALARIDIAFFSSDAYPERSPSFMRVCLDAPNLAWFQTMSAGVDHPIFGMLLDKGVRLTTSSGSAAPPIARTALMYLLALSRDLPGWLGAQRQHRWDMRGFTELEGQTVGIAGMGPIGCEVARLTAAIGMTPIGLRRVVRGDEPCETWTLDRLLELAHRADALVIALPLADETRGLVTSQVLDALGPGGLFVNVGRGEIVDEPALIDALQTKRIKGAGLDVFATEPLPDDSPLWDLPNVIITPHSSGSTDGTGHRAALQFIDNLRRWTKDEPLENEVTPNID